MRIILDTGVFYHPDAWAGLGSATVVVPSIVYMERMRQLRRDGQDVARFERALEQLGVEVEAFTRVEAARIHGLEDRRWNRLARDAMVACHVLPEDLLWTTNPRDFLELGLGPNQVVALG